jgi:hypothetical protein
MAEQWVDFGELNQRVSMADMGALPNTHDRLGVSGDYKAKLPSER